MGDHESWARGVEGLEDEVSGGRAVIVGRTGDPGKAAALVRRHRPHVVVVDDRPGVVKELSGGPARVLVLCREVDPETALAALRAGASGVLPAKIEAGALVAPLLAVASGLNVVPAGILALLTGSSAGHRTDPSNALTPEERELWRMVAAGLDL
ncbi:MAG: DNA-binding response regulator, partial [Acidimicrobiia bacterium]